MRRCAGLRPRHPILTERKAAVEHNWGSESSRSGYHHQVFVRCSLRIRASRSSVDINKLIRSVLEIVHHDLQKNGVEVQDCTSADQASCSGRQQSPIAASHPEPGDERHRGHAAAEPRVLNHHVEADRKRQPPGLDRGHRTRHRSIQRGSRSSSRFSPPRNAAWEWVFPSATRSSSATTAGFGCRRVPTEVQYSNLICRQ